MLLRAALLKDCAEKAKASETVNSNPTSCSPLDDGKGTNFLLRTYKMLSHDREISGVQIASSLLQLPTYYTARDRFVNVNLHWLRQHV